MHPLFTPQTPKSGVGFLYLSTRLKDSLIGSKTQSLEKTSTIGEAIYRAFFTPAVMWASKSRTDPLSTTAPLTPCATFTVCFSPKYREADFFCIASRDPIPRYAFIRTPSWKKYSPGVSVVPARTEPIMQTLAPKFSAFTM